MKPETNYSKVIIRKGDIYIAKLEAKGSVQGGERPVIIFSNNLNNEHCPTIQIIPISTKTNKKYPMHVDLFPGISGLNEESIALLEQIQTINKTQLKEKIGYVNYKTICELEDAVNVQLGMIKPIDIKKINDILYLINEATEMYNETKKEYYERNIGYLEGELREYCNKYKVNYEHIIENKKIKSIMFTKNGAVING